MSAELDREVAEKVMGWTLSENGHFYGVAHNMAGPDKMIRYFECWHPSTNIAQAYEVAQYVAGFPGQWFQFGIDYNGMHEDGPYTAAFADPNGPIVGVTGTPRKARAETACLAICLAALAATGRGEGRGGG